MNFTKVQSGIDNTTSVAANEKLSTLFNWFALNENNSIANKGGSVELLFVAITHEHELTNEADNLQLVGNTVKYNPNFVTNTEVSVLRKKFESLFTKDYLTKNAEDLRSDVLHLTDEAKVVAGNIYAGTDLTDPVVSGSLAKNKTYYTASSLYETWVAALDGVSAKQSSDVAESTNVMNWLGKLPAYMFLFLTRTKMGIEKIINMQLDSVEPFSSKLLEINKLNMNIK